MKLEYRKMILELIKSVAINLALTTVILILILAVLNQFFNVQLQISSTALVMGIIGALLAFAGNSFVTDALGRFDAHGLPQYKWGNRIQTVGFALTIGALLVR